jgi:hypothetical protein
MKSYVPHLFTRVLFQWLNRKSLLANLNDRVDSQRKEVLRGALLERRD